MNLGPHEACKVYTGGPEQLSELLKRLRRYYKKDKTNGWAALYALSPIANKAVQRRRMPDDKMSGNELFPELLGG
jgi:hypothetical protein